MAKPRGINGGRGKGVRTSLRRFTYGPILITFGGRQVGLSVRLSTCQMIEPDSR